MLSDFRRKKFLLGFSRFDADQNGLITQQDYETLAERTIAALGIDATGERAQMIKAANLQVWAGLQQGADQNGDQAVDQNEYLNFWTMMTLNQEFFNQMVGVIVQRLINGFDVDQDGKLSPTEWALICQVYGFSEDANLTFAQLDQDRDGYLTPAELMDMTTQYYYSEDETSPGNWIWGAVR